MTDPETRPSTVELAATAAQAVRDLNHRTLGPDAVTGPAQLYRLVGELILLADGLPQLVNQLGRWLQDEHDADRVRSDDHADPGPTVARVTIQMTDAGDAACDLARALGRAQQHLAQLSSNPAAGLDPPADPPSCSTRPQVVPCSWQDGGPITLASDTAIHHRTVALRLKANQLSFVLEQGRKGLLACHRAHARDVKPHMEPASHAILLSGATEVLGTSAEQEAIRAGDHKDLYRERQPPFHISQRRERELIRSGRFCIQKPARLGVPEGCRQRNVLPRRSLPVDA